MAKISFCPETLEKGFFLGAVKLHCPISDNYISHNLGGTVSMSVCTELLEPKKGLGSSFAIAKLKKEKLF